MTIRILIVDDHSVVRQGLRIFLRTDPEFEVVGEANNGEQAVRLAAALRPDIVLMDLLMPVMDGVEATHLIQKEMADTEIIALTSVLEDRSVVSAIKAGAIGYLLKDTESEDLCRAIKAAAQGKVQLSPEAAARLRSELSAPEQTEPLTKREACVLEFLGKGASNKEIAFHLSIAESTVKTHVSTILMKLGVQSRTQAAVIATQASRSSLVGRGIL